MHKKILITGANGALARATANLLKDSNFDVVFYTTNRTQVDNKINFFWNPELGIIDANALDGCSHIIHLSGMSIMKPWTKKNKQLMYSSRVSAAQLIFETCQANNIKVQTFISASAIGFYGLNTIGLKSEEDLPEDDWLSKMSVDWESAATRFEEIGSRVVKMRISLLFSKGAGYLKAVLLLMKFGIAPIFGSGKRSLAWIHLNDAARFIEWSINNTTISGAYNLATENNSNQIQLVNEMRRLSSKYSIIIFIPSFILRLLVGEKSKILEGGASISLDKLRSSGFECKYTLKSIFNSEL